MSEPYMLLYTAQLFVLHFFSQNYNWITSFCSRENKWIHQIASVKVNFLKKNRNKNNYLDRLHVRRTTDMRYMPYFRPRCRQSNRNHPMSVDSATNSVTQSAGSADVDNIWWPSGNTSSTFHIHFHWEAHKSVSPWNYYPNRPCTQIRVDMNI